jgi:hypothetical protein
MPRGVTNTAVLDVTNTDEGPGAPDFIGADEDLDAIGRLPEAFTPIRAYNMLHEMERVLIPDKNPGKDDPELRKRIQFYAGTYLCRNQTEVDALTGKRGVVFEDFAPGQPDHLCPRCGRPFRNMRAFDAHVLTHME